MRSPLCMKLLSSPIRQCFVTKRRMPSKMMLRFVRVRKGEDSIRVIPDFEIASRSFKGKGVWLHPACLNYAMRHEMFERAFRDYHQKDRKVMVPEDLVNRVVEKLKSDFYRALSEAKRQRVIRLKHENQDVDFENNNVHLILTTNKSSIIEDLVPGNRPTVLKTLDTQTLHKALEEEENTIDHVQIVHRGMAERIYQAAFLYDECISSP